MNPKRLVLLPALLLALMLWLLTRPATQKPVTAAKPSPQTPPAKKASGDSLDELYDQLMSAAPKDTKPVPFKSKGRVHLKPGESAVLGFWQMSENKNGLAIITPKPQPDGTLKLEARLMNVTDAVTEDQAVRDLFPTPFDIEQYGAIDAGATQSAIQHLSRADGADNARYAIAHHDARQKR